MKKSSEQYIKGNTSRFALTVGEFNVLIFFMLKPNEKDSKMNYLAAFGAHVIILLLLYIFLNVFLNIWRQFFRYLSRQNLMKNKILENIVYIFRLQVRFQPLAFNTTGFLIRLQKWRPLANEMTNLEYQYGRHKTSGRWKPR